jgi:hypothetical protein
MTSLRRTLARILQGPVGGMFLCLLIAGLLGGVATAHPGGKTDRPTPTTAPSGDPSEAPEAPEQDQGGGGQQGGGATTHTAADCQGTLTGVEGLPAVQDATGLAHAIWVVEANCEKNPQAPGLVNALGHLVTNWQRHQAHEAETAAAGHGPPQVHGNGGVHGNSGEHGNPGHGPSGTSGTAGSGS